MASGTSASRRVDYFLFSSVVNIVVVTGLILSLLFFSSFCFLVFIFPLTISLTISDDAIHPVTVGRDSEPPTCSIALAMP